MNRPRQIPGPGARLIACKGDLITFSLDIPEACAGIARLRTNIGRGRIRLAETVAHIESSSPLMANDWHDFPMRKDGHLRFSITIPVLEVGRFEAKAFFLPDGSHEPVWPEGTNVVIKVEPAEYCCANTIYCAFVRQFGPNKYQWSAPELSSALKDSVKSLDKEGYSVIPQSGRFRDLVKELDFIMGTLRCRIIHLLPVHPIPTTYARMGRFGSPFAALDFMEVDPAMAEFDRRTTPVDQFVELADAVHQRGGRLFIDIPVNHTGWASHLQIEHPEWFSREADKSFHSPGAWGVTWEDLSKLDYSRKDLWRYMANMFTTWCRRGVDGFRCDAGYMVPFEAWEYMIAKVRQEYPDAIFLLEGLGGKLEVVERLLADADMDWAYSELFQNYDRSQLEFYLPDANRVSATKGMLVHYAETHDNVRMAARSQGYARMRTAFSALASHSGAFGITNGVEWFATEKVDVHDAPPLNWGSQENQVPHIARLNSILRAHPCFHSGAEMRLVQRGDHNVLAILRESVDRSKRVLVLVNLDAANASRVSWDPTEFPVDGTPLVDLVSGRQVVAERFAGLLSCPLGAGEVLCLTANPADEKLVRDDIALGIAPPARAVAQGHRAKAIAVHMLFHEKTDASALDADALGRRLAEDPVSFCASMSGERLPAVVNWQWPRDLRREVMIPPGSLLCISAPHRFTATIVDGSKTICYESSLPRNDGSHFVLMLPFEAPAAHRRMKLLLTVFEPRGCCRRDETELLFLSSGRAARAKASYDRDEVVAKDCFALCTNGRGAMAQVRGAWGEVRTQYDALLSGNLHPEFPVDRRVMFPRCRAWLVFQGYSHSVNVDCLTSFGVAEDGSATWKFTVPSGQGMHVTLEIKVRMVPGENMTLIGFHRSRAGRGEDRMEDKQAVRLILRPDLEDRGFHEKTKAYMGADHSWPNKAVAGADHVIFHPSNDHYLRLALKGGTFAYEPEWSYMVGHPHDAERGFDGSTDVFSPGYFGAWLKGGSSVLLKAEILPGRPAQSGSDSPVEADKEDGFSWEHDRQGAGGELKLDKALERAMHQFIVKRNELKTVIAGYPWFLDWGRDTLIFLRGMVAAGMIDEATQILLEFARLERNGTIPNMIRGGDDSNRDTSDAPLWFFAVCRDLFNQQRRGKASLHAWSFLKTDCGGGRPLKDVLKSIVEAYAGGTPNGIGMDPDSGLIFSPSHYTWMDTNHPAGTPREGYPVEIQALWHSALAFMAEVEPHGRWGGLAKQVRASIERLYPRHDGRGGVFLSDCLHANHRQSAAQAVADDALRSNQLLAVTLGALHDEKLKLGVVTSCEELLVPGAIRSLADRPVEYHLPVIRFGQVLNDPARPYWGHYAGDEDTCRKPAYHNGTAWTWPFPSYCEALLSVCGESARDRAWAILSSVTEIMDRDCICQLPELTDGDIPHRIRGCGAQAWGISETLRVLRLLSGK